jgi:hypothetical protein
MKTSDPKLAGGESVVGSRADLVLARSLVILAPLVRWLLRSGVHYGNLAQALKTVFLDEARRELERQGRNVTDSALSVLSGVHRKDVRALGATAEGGSVFASTPASRLLVRWLTDPRFRHTVAKQSAPTVLKRLSRTGDQLSFEMLAREVSKDVHPRTLLEELVRLDQVRLDGDDVVLNHTGFMPTTDDDRKMQLLVANAADHLAAAVSNATTDGPRFLEQSVFADGLSDESVRRLADHARVLWQPALEGMVAAANERVEADDQNPNTPMRVRFGVYYFHDRMGDAPAESTASGNLPPPESKS